MKKSEFYINYEELNLHKLEHTVEGNLVLY